MKSILTAGAIAALTALPVTAFEMDAMSPAERDAFRAEIRAYLLENPEVLLEAINVLEQRQAEAQAADDINLVSAHADALFSDPNSYVGGNPDGDLTIVEFLDYRCGFCKRAHPEVNALIANDGNLRYVIKELPILGEESVLASRFAIAVLRLEGREAYATVHDELMTLRAGISEDSLRALGARLELSTEAIMAEMDSDAVTSVINKNRALASAMQINGTPSFVFETQMVRGYVTLDQMNALVAELRAEG